MPTSAIALPQGGNVTAGAATISTPTGTSMRVDQTTDRLIMDWTRFNIAANESVRFQQPSAASIALNRVLGPEPSAIFGSLSANGQIVLINPSGILFGAGSRVDVGALTASTLNMRNQDFLAGQYRFTQDPALANAAVVNQGVITAGPGGYVALLGAATRNEGVIQAQLGSIALAAGRAATLDMRGDGLIQFVVSDAVAGNVISPDGKPLASYVSNTGTLQADGGRVILQAKAAGDVIKSVVNQEGVVRATSLVNRGGVITLIAEGDHATVSNSGILDVSAGEPHATPGAITVHSDGAVSLGGTVMQYVGDAVMAVFGAPDPAEDHAVSAVRASCDMHRRQRELDLVWAGQGLAAFGLGIGLSTGEVAAALLGSDERVEYTLVGDTVNLAQRMQDLARPAGTVAAQRFTWEGTVGGTPRVTARVNWLMGEDLDPPWKLGGERFEVAFDADPPLHVTFGGLHPPIEADNPLAAASNPNVG